MLTYFFRWAGRSTSFSSAGEHGLQNSGQIPRFAALHTSKNGNLVRIIIESSLPVAIA